MLVFDVLADGEARRGRAHPHEHDSGREGRELGEALSRDAGPALRQRVADRLAELTASRSGA